MSAPPPTCAPERLALPDLDATRDLARAIAGVARPGDVVGLAGVLGAGKTTFARAFVNARAEAAGSGPVEVPSPTFTLVQPYDIGATTVFHFDLYRVDVPEDALELGIEDAFATGISLVEWPDRLGLLMPEDALLVTLLQGARENAREAEIEAGPGWSEHIGGTFDRFRAQA
ncbi:MAG: tRNA (adenosine(37)-N6)-threonylcarbamoyltransferase complex ATPase subunit type 1 TsaE [Defluviicoccus sp.]|nr:tRNA (adenosine(37)-N6)-threonylcarbamoyltransferase complex ATPase subunit type 1 TsaE [Defluviicoccus sp.]